MPCGDPTKNYDDILAKLEERLTKLEQEFNMHRDKILKLLKDAQLI
jgi:hypothetical protein